MPREQSSHPRPSEAIGLMGFGKTMHRNATEKLSVVLQLGTAGMFGINSELLGI